MHAYTQPLLEPTSPAIDFTAAYRELAGPLAQLVRTDVRTSEEVVEDACQEAWSRLWTHGSGVQAERTLSWLATTARREALRLQRHTPYERPLEPGQVSAAASTVDALAERREQLARVNDLPARQQRMLWMRMLGFRCDEIGNALACTPRTVDRQLARARAKVRSGWEDEGQVQPTGRIPLPQWQPKTGSPSAESASPCAASSRRCKTES